jgi:4,5-dihydroxyphthalate decarboxylase
MTTVNNKVISTISRRHFIKNTMMTACAVSLVPGYVSAVNGSESSKKLPLQMAGYNFDRVAALIEGRVGIENCELQFDVSSIGEMNTHIFSGNGTRDISEVGLHPYMLAYANNGFREYSLLPVFPLRVFRHKSIFINTDSGIHKPEDLRGKKVATPGFSSTSLTWLRGIMQQEYGVRPEDIHWVISSKDSSADIGGKVSKQENVIPKGLTVSNGPAGKDESELLVDGDVDALFHAIEPRAYVEGHPKIARLFTNYRRIERDYYQKTGIFPIMHAVAMRNDVVNNNPWLPEAVFNGYSQAKQIMYQQMNKLGWATNSLPWFGKELEDTQALMGKNFWSYGIEANRTVLETLFQYSYEQGLAKQKLQIEDLFHPSTLDFKDI